MKWFFALGVLVLTGVAMAQPASTAREQLDWMLEQLILEPGEASANLRGRFTEQFLESVGEQVLAIQILQLQAITLGRGPLVVERVEPGETDTSITAIVRSEATRSPLRLVVVTSPDGRIAGFGMTPVAIGGKLGVERWQDLDGLLAGLHGTTSMSAMRLVDGELEPVHLVNPDEQLAIGSAFKLYVIGALAALIGEGEASWDEPLAIEESLKSLPSGTMQELAAGTTMPISAFAGQMISISDNTATDHLIHRIGRERVEAFLSAHQEDASRTIPFMTTHEMFSIKLCGDPALAERYAAAGVERRRAMLAGEVAEAEPKMMIASSWTLPSHVEEIEWFASTSELCSVMVALHRLGREQAPLWSALTINPGMAFLSSEWKQAAFKGGSEPGVLNFTWLLQRVDGEVFLLSMTWNDGGAPVDIAVFLDLAAEAAGLLHGE